MFFLAALLIASSVVYGQSRTSLTTVDRVLSEAERRIDRELRTVRVPAGHPNHGTTTFGRERNAKATLAQVDAVSRGRILNLRLFSGALAIIGCNSLAMGRRPKRKKPTHRTRKLPYVVELPSSKKPNFESLDELHDAIVSFIEYYNKTLANPYSWTYTGKILSD